MRMKAKPGSLSPGTLSNPFTFPTLGGFLEGRIHGLLVPNVKPELQHAMFFKCLLNTDSSQTLPRTSVRKVCMGTDSLSLCLSWDWT